MKKIALGFLFCSLLFCRLGPAQNPPAAIHASANRAHVTAAAPSLNRIRHPNRTSRIPKVEYV